MLAYDADLELFRDNFKRFMNEHIAPHYDQWEREGIMPRSVWSQLGENGFLCVDVPEEYGGYGVPTYYSLMLVEESARAGFCALSTAISCHSEIAAPYILHIGTEEQKQYWLPKMVTGEVVGAICSFIKRLKLSRNNSKSASYANIIFSFGFIVLSNLIAVHANHFLHNCHGLAAHLNCTFQSANK
ncbi:acyl-CoA dehydrogenase family protein, partial [Acinetobacter baumannii]|uniref:acyl-CoA dehydrogenase family protein n=1 Tax=Acinetobacter baumannii TaxID=470 RepID=UPI001D170C7E